MPVKITRRKLVVLGLGAATGASLGRYLNNTDMKQAPIHEGMVLCDLHAHPTHKVHLDTLVEALSSPGMVGLTVKNIDESGKDILRYEQALDVLPAGSFTELDKGRLAKCGKGYFARTQEIRVGKHHLLVVGWRGGYFPNFENIDDAVKKIHEQDGIAILNHPFALVLGQNVRLPESDAERDEIRDAYGCVDEVETFNAYCIDLIPLIVAMKQANRDAENLRREEFPHFRGTAGSDCHRRWAQVKIAGIYIGTRAVESGMDGIKGAITNGEFERLGDSETGPYVSRGSFILGMGGDMLATLR